MLKDLVSTELSLLGTVLIHIIYDSGDGGGGREREVSVKKSCTELVRDSYDPYHILFWSEREGVWILQLKYVIFKVNSPT